MNMNRFGKVLVTVAAIIVLVALALGILNYVKHYGLVKVVVQALPSDSWVKIDNLPAKSGVNYLKPGAHEISAGRQYFDTVTKHIDTKDISSSETIYLLPLANSQESKDWLSRHPVEQQQREAVGGLEAEKKQQELAKKYPVVSALPTYNSHYRIDYSFGSDDKPKFTITLYAIINRPDEYDQYRAQLKQYKSEALKFLVQNGINPQNYQISYVPNV